MKPGETSMRGIAASAHFIGMKWEHITDHDLERYYLGMVTDETELAALESHILACGSCAERANEAQEYVDAMRAASLDFEEEARRPEASMKPPPDEVCPDRIRLTNAHAIRALALSMLTQGLYTKTGAELLKASVENDKAAAECAAAWIALQEHKRQHGC
jgi:hypothetical protein